MGTASRPQWQRRPPVPEFPGKHPLREDLPS